MRSIAGRHSVAGGRLLPPRISGGADTASPLQMRAPLRRPRAPAQEPRQLSLLALRHAQGGGLATKVVMPLDGCLRAPPCFAKRLRRAGIPPPFPRRPQGSPYDPASPRGFAGHGGGGPRRYAGSYSSHGFTALWAAETEGDFMRTLPRKLGRTPRPRGRIKCPSVSRGTLRRTPAPWLRSPPAAAPTRFRRRCCHPDRPRFAKRLRRAGKLRGLRQRRRLAHPPAAYLILPPKPGWFDYAHHAGDVSASGHVSRRRAHHALGNAGNRTSRSPT